MISTPLLRSLSVLLLIIWSQHGIAQLTEPAHGLIPHIVGTYSFTDKLKLRSSLASRQSILPQEGSAEFKYILTDWTNLISMRTGASTSIQAGLLTRFETKRVVHRAIQRVTIISPMSTGRLAHRIGLDQTFAESQRPVFRARYRITYEIPLNGFKVDPREFYLKANTEGLFIYSSEGDQVEFRFVPLLGYEMDKAQKIEFGADYRVFDINDPQGLSIIWWSINYYFSF